MSTNHAGERGITPAFDDVDNVLLPELFATTERWGWEYHSPTARVPPVSPAPLPAIPASGAAFAVCGLAELFPVRRSSFIALVFAVAAVVFGIYAPRWDTGLAAAQANGVPGATKLSFHFVSWTPCLWLVAAVMALWALILPFVTRRMLHDWMVGVARAREAFARETERWSASEEAFRRGEEQRLRSEPQWFAIRIPSLRRLDVFGGTPGGWKALLVSVGCSLLGAGDDVNVVDLSRDEAARALTRAAQAHGYSTSEVALPGESVVTNVFGGLGAAEVADVLTQTAHGWDEEKNYAQRSMDARLLTAVCEALDAPLTISRVCAALRVPLNQEPAAGTPGAQLGEQEYDRIADLFAEAYLQHTAERLAALESILHPLAVLGRDGAQRENAIYAPLTRLQVVRIDEDTTMLSAKATALFVLQLLLSDMRGQASPKTSRRTVFVAGADELPGSDVERLAQLARRRGVRLILLFRHLRDDAEELLGGSDAAYFMRLGNTAEADRAAEFIGREHRFVIHQSSLAVTEGSNTGESVSFNRGSSTSRIGGGSTSRSMTQGTSTGDSRALADSTGRERVYEFAVERTALQTLPDTVFVFVDPTRPRPRARVGDCDPRLLGLDITRDRLAPPPAP